MERKIVSILCVCEGIPPIFDSKHQKVHGMNSVNFFANKQASKDQKKEN